MAFSSLFGAFKRLSRSKSARKTAIRKSCRQRLLRLESLEPRIVLAGCAGGAVAAGGYCWAIAPDLSTANNPSLHATQRGLTVVPNNTIPWTETLMQQVATAMGVGNDGDTFCCATSLWYDPANNSVFTHNFGGSGFYNYGEWSGYMPVHAFYQLNPPVVNSSGDSGTHPDNHNHSLSWSASDPDGNLSSVSAILRRNGVQINSSAGTSGTFTVTPSNGLGTFTLTVTATDSGGLQDVETRSVTIQDDDTSLPVITLGGSTTNESDGANNRFDWSVSDSSGIFDSDVTISKVGIGTIYSNSFSTSGSFDLNGQGVGTFTISIAAIDNDSDWSGDRATSTFQRTITITDDDTSPPTIDILTGSSSDGLDNFFTWNVTDPSGVFDTDVTIMRGASTLFTATVPSGAYFLDPDGLGEFTIGIVATDNDNDWAGDRLTTSASTSLLVFDDDTEAPLITLGGSEGSVDDGQLQSFSWNVSDASELSALSITITKDGAEIFSTTNTADAVGSFEFDSYGLGSYTIGVSATDGDGDWSGDSSTASAIRSVTVSDDDLAGPAIVLGGSAGTESHGLAQVFSWDVTDASELSGLSVVIRKDGAEIYSTTATADAVGSFNFDSYGLGSFTMDVAATDSDSDWTGDTSSATATRSVLVTNAAPVAQQDMVSVPEDGAVTFNPLDDHGSGPDIDSDGDTLTVIGVTQPQKGTAVLNSDGTITYTPGVGCNCSQDTFSYTIDDGYGGTAISTITITIDQYTGAMPVSGGVLRVGGAVGDDIITVSDGNLIVNGTPHSLAGVTEVRIWGRAGHDQIDLVGLAIPSFVDAGAGNDIVSGGNAEDVIFGGMGDDTITGGAGNDFLIGGEGKDRIVGSAGHDILVAGDIDCGLDLAALRAISQAWADSHTAASLETAEGPLDDSLVDGESDVLTGSAGADLFFTSENDKITDFQLNKPNTNKDGDVVVTL